MDVVVPELPINLLCIPGGRISVKVAVPNRPSVHAMLPSEKLLDNLAAIERNMNIERRNRYMGQQHAEVYASIVRTVTEQVMTEQIGIAVAVAALWCAINHPREHNEMRKALVSYLSAAKHGFVSFEAFDDGRVAIGTSQAPISEVAMSRAKDDAAAMNREGEEKMAKDAD